MKKNYFILLAVMMLFTVSAKAQTPVATLYHNGEITVFHGYNAFTNAANAAVDDDIINLSPGVFKGALISHKLKIYGAGMYNLEDEKNATVISSGGDNNASLSLVFTNGANGTYLEGLYIDKIIQGSKNSGHPDQLIFNKCLTKSFYYNLGHQATANTLNFINCIIMQNPNTIKRNCFNCYCNEFESLQSFTNADNSYINCVLRSTGKMYLSMYDVYANCIFVSATNTGTPNTQGYVNASNNIFVGTDNIFASAVNGENWLIPNISDVFKTFNGTYTLGCDFELADAAKQYLGIDGTQIGIYGGTVPFTAVVGNPRITKCVVDRQTSPEGQLNVDIEVKEGL